MHRFGKFLALKKKLFRIEWGRDLFLTATSVLSRNYRVGLKLAQNQKLDSILAELNEVAEGVKLLML